MILGDTHHPPRILVVDDSLDNVGIIRQFLKDQNFSIAVAQDGRAALDTAARLPLNLILLDIMMPEIDGFEVCARLKQNPKTQDIPVIFMTALHEVEYKVRGLNLGAVDYVTKPLQREELIARIRTHLKLRQLQRQVEEQNLRLQCSLTQVQAVLDNSPVGTAFLNIDRYFLEVNSQFVQLFGHTKHELLGETAERLFPSRNDYEQLAKDAYPVLNRGEVYEAEHLLQRKDGGRFWCRLRARAVDYLDPNQGFVWNVEDVTQRKLAEDELRLASKVFDNISEAVMVTDPTNMIIAVNPAFCRITGYRREEVLGQFPGLLSSGRHDQAFYREMWDRLLLEGQWQGEVWNRRKEGEIYPIWLTINVVRRPDQMISHYVALFADITLRKRSEDRLQHQAHYDALTQLPNRALFYERLHQSLQQAWVKRDKLALFYIDLDGFKQVNDQLGHDAGDAVLKIVAENLLQCVREQDLVARLGGDEFVAILSNLDSGECVSNVARRVLEKLNLKVGDNGNSLSISGSIGIAFYPDDADTETALLQAADDAMYQAKAMGKNTYYRAQSVRPPSLPTNPAPAAETPAALRISAAAPPPPRRLLYIENNPMEAYLCQGVLENEAFVVDIAHSGQEGLALMHDGRYELVLVNHQLPDMTGLEVLDYIRQQALELPAVFITAEDATGLAVTALRHGAVDYLRKGPDLIALLPSVVERALETSNLLNLRHEANEAKQQRQLYSSIFDSAFVAFLMVSAQGRVVDANLAACNLFGYSHAELLKLHSKTLIHPESYPLFKQFLDTAQEFPMSAGAAIRKDGSSISVEVNRSLVRHHGESYILAVMRDITERKLAEERLHQAAIVFDHSAEAVLITDPEMHIVAANKAFTEITGYSEVEVLGKTPRLLKSDLHDRPFYQSMWASLQELGFWQGEIWNRRKDGGLFPAWQNISQVRHKDGTLHHYVSVFSDITERKSAEEQIQHLLHYDVLTKLPNRLLFSEQFKHSLGCAEAGQHQIALLFLGLDRFKKVNDSLGYSYGDRLLQQAAERLRSQLDGRIVARLSGDEFALFLDAADPSAQAASLAGRLISALSDPFQVDAKEFHLSASVGISIYPQDGREVTTLIKHADTAMSRAKEQGGGAYQFYSHQLTASVSERLQLENDLRHALQDGDQLFLLYQPQIELGSGKVVGVEALARWNHPELGLISPLKFIPVAEESGLICPLGQWVLRTACAQAQFWRDTGLALERVAVNLSALEVQRGDIVNSVTHVLKDTGLAADSLELEITETMVMHEIERASGVLQELRELGVHLAIDDFGTGYSSLNYLKKLPVNKLKLDRSFLQGVEVSTSEAKIMAAIIALGRSLQLHVICEGVETPAQEDFLKRHGCHQAQGFLYSVPLSVAELESFLARQV